MIYSEKATKNLSIVALGSSQVEFFTESGKDIFTIYSSDPDSPRKVMLNLREWKVLKTDEGFELTRGSMKHTLMICEKGNAYYAVFVSSRWGGSLCNRHKGEVSPKGFNVLNENFSKHT